jgi:hypothetical protein
VIKTIISIRFIEGSRAELAYPLCALRSRITTYALRGKIP